MACETFRLDRWHHPETWEPKERGGYFSFCKTRRLPYDLLVCAVLILLKHHFPKSEVSSDGDYSDWVPAREWYQSVFPTRDLPEDGPWQEGYEEQE